MEAATGLEGMVPGIQEVVVRVLLGQDHMVEEVRIGPVRMGSKAALLIGQVQDFMEGQGHLNTSQEHMEGAVHPEAGHLGIAVRMEGLGLGDVIRINYF